MPALATEHDRVRVSSTKFCNGSFGLLQGFFFYNSAFLITLIEIPRRTQAAHYILFKKQFHAKQEENNRLSKEQKKDEYIREDINNISETETNEVALKD